MNRFFFTVIQSLLLFDSTKQSNIGQAKVTVKAIGKTIKSPMLKQIGNIIKKPVMKTVGNAMKNSMSILRRNKNTIKNIACGLQEKYLKTGHNFGSKSVKYLGEVAINKFKYMAPQTARSSNRLVRASGKQNIQMRSATQMRGKDLSSLINMVSKSKPQLPFLVGGGLLRLNQLNLVDFDPTPNLVDSDPTPVDYKDIVRVEGWEGDKDIGKPEGKQERLLDDDDPVEQTAEDKLEPTGDQKQNNTTAMEDSDIPEGNLGYDLRKFPLQNAYQTPKTYEGIWADGLIKHQFRNGDYYEGYIKSGKMHGEGKVIYKLGDSYTGNFENGRYNGKGKMEYQVGITYVGDFVVGKMTGKGHLTYKERGETYVGEFNDGKMEGKGKFNYPNGDVYEGDVVNNRRHGEGKMIFDGGSTFEGSFKEDLFEGKGKKTTKYGTFYDGEYKKGEKNGYGEFFFGNGDHYKGNWKDDKYDGKGEFYFKEKDETQSCMWKNGKPVEE